MPVEVAVVNKGLPGLTLTPESFFLVNEEGRRYPAVGGKELADNYGDVDVDRRLGVVAGLGAHVMGPGAEEQLNLFALAMKSGITANQIKSAMFAYPSYASDLGYMA